MLLYTIRNELFMKTWIFARFFLQRAPLYLSLSIVLLVVSRLLSAVTILCLVPVMDILVKPDLSSTSPVTRYQSDLMSKLGFSSTLLSFLIVFWIMALVSCTTSMLAANYILRAKYMYCRDLYVGMTKDILTARWSFFSFHSQGKLMNTLNRELNNVGFAFSCVVILIGDIITITINFAIPFYLSWSVTLVSVIAAAILALPFLFLSGVSYRLGRHNTSSGNYVQSVLYELLGLIKVIVGFGNQEKSLSRMRQAFDEHVVATIRFQTYTQLVPAIYTMVSMFILGLSLYTASMFQVAFSETAVILLILYQTLPRLGSVAEGWAHLDGYYASYEQITMLREHAIQMRQHSAPLVFKGFNRDLTLDHVCFGYPGCPQLLIDINLRILRGSMVAIVGQSGVGKSTLIDLIMGFHEPTSGVIRFDGIPLNEFDINAYRRRVGYVPQDSVLFNMSIRDNLLWANDSASDYDLRRACEQANAAEFIELLQDKYDTLVGDRGTRLSGGQIQRLALARAILRQPALLILDEATSALDSTSERLIQQAIESIARETTVIVIAHRLSTIINADHIIVLQNGRVVGQDRYQTLLSNNSFFCEMVKAQLLGETT